MESNGRLTGNILWMPPRRATGGQFVRKGILPLVPRLSRRRWDPREAPGTGNSDAPIT